MRWLSWVLLVAVSAVSSSAHAQWETVEMPPRAQAAVLGLDDGRIFVFGGADAEGLVGTTLIYLDGDWTEGPPLPTARRGAAACLDAGGLIHLVGGFGDGAQRQEHDVLDPDTLIWTTEAPLPAPGWELACATDPEGNIHVVGGESRLARHDIWDGEAWAQGDALPEGRLQHDALFGPDGRLFVLGGGTRNELRSDLLVWTPGTGWESLPGPPVQVRQAAAGWLLEGAALAVVGGSTAYNNNAAPYFDAVQFYDVEAQRWRAGPALAMPARELGFAVIGGRIHAVGGRAGEFLPMQVAVLGDLVGAPEIVQDIPASVAEGTATMVAADVLDPEGDSVSVTWEIAGEVFDGPFAVLRAPDGDAILPVTVTAVDALGGIQRVEAEVRVENVAPMFLGTPETTARPGFVYRFEVHAVDPAGPADPLEIELVASPDGMVFDAGVLEWTPAVGIEAADVRLVARDDDGAQGELSWRIFVGGDADEDGVLDGVDNCPDVPNPAQINSDLDEMGNECDLDDDNDGLADELDNCPLTAGASGDIDGDGIGDLCDPDDDNDGIDDPFDATPSGGLGDPSGIPLSADAASGCGAAGLARPWSFSLRRR